MKKPWERPINEGDIAILAMVAAVIAIFIFSITLF